ncbi:transglutaminase-like domain-containing protein [Calycomorphotria hydatis]|uniref:Transglutaminase-like superfamily protein n=1 Tax=Calycomorphotria hydatis TaxID=2528027 RepID=A0A517TA24_9PLAN|nr:transglutaminase-like domain-containing protein [Calycomorphotria hydatis]QDT65215.1 Transglutaminase-like superfamily protein [Calycomorphotria hydatis]
MRNESKKKLDMSQITVPTTVTLSLLACSILTLAAGSDDHPYWMYGELALQWILTIAAASWVSRKAPQWKRPPAVSPLLVLLALLTFVCEPIHRLLGAGRPGEIVLMDGLQHVVLGLAVVSHWLVYRRLAALLSLFLMMFAVSITQSLAIQVLAGIFSAVAIFWAAATHWEGLHDSILAKTESRMPRWWLGGLAAAVVLILSTVTMGGNRVLNNLQGFFPSSGGDGWYDPYARDGVRDGDAVVAGTKDIKSFAPIEDAPFMVDKRPTLYDVFDDSYEEPYTQQKREKAIGLDQQFFMDRCQERLAALKKAGKEFSTFRKPRNQKKNDRLTDRGGDALFYVAGRTPLHLRLCTHDLFDGEVWVHEEDKEGTISIREVEDKLWAVLPMPPPSFAIFGATEGHTLKIIDLDTAVIPAPLHTRGVHIDKINRADFFKIVHADIPAMDREVLPPLTTIHLSSEVIDPAKLIDEWKMIAGAGASYTQWPDHPDWKHIQGLAEDCASDKKKGWAQVSAIVDHLQANYRYERGVGTLSRDQSGADPVHDPGDHSHSGHHHHHEGHHHGEIEQLPVSCFLFETKVGDDYHFATAAALMLRSLGYSTRLVQGFYASPDDYDPKAQNTPIKVDDVHTWVEVYLGTGTWITVEPTPGFEVLGPPPTIIERFQTACVVCIQFVGNYPLAFGSLIVCVIAVVVYRKEIANTVDALAWKLSYRNGTREQWLAAARILQRRARRAGLVRPSAMTLRRWLQTVCRTEGRESAEQLLSFLNELDRLSYQSTSSTIGNPLLPNQIVTEHSFKKMRLIKRGTAGDSLIQPTFTPTRYSPTMTNA